MRCQLCLAAILLLALVVSGCGSDDTIAPPVEAPEGSRNVAFEVHRSSLDITAATYSIPTGIAVQRSLMAVGKGGRGFIYPGHTFATPLFLETTADVLDVHYANDSIFAVCGSREVGGSAYYLIAVDDVRYKPAHSFDGNFTGCWWRYVCSDSGAILEFDLFTHTIDLVFQAPAGVSFQALVGNPGGEELWALGNDGAIYHREPGGVFLDESVSDGPDFVSADILLDNKLGTVFLYAVGDDEVWKLENDEWTMAYDLAEHPLTDVQVLGDGYAVAAGDDGLVLKEDQYGWWNVSIDPGFDISALALNPIDEELDACGTGGQVLVYDDVDWIDLKQHAVGRWTDFQVWGDGRIVAANGNVLLGYTSGDWEAFAVWDWGYEIIDFHVLAEDDIWAIGVMADGLDHFVLHFDGSIWSVMRQSSMDGFNAIWCDASGDNVYVAADFGMIWRHHADTWELAVNLGTAADFNDLSGVSEINLRAVGEGGLVMRWRADGWVTEATGTSQALRAISGGAAVGDGGIVLISDGIRWNAVDLSWDDNLKGVWSDSPGNIWVVGEEAFVLQFDGTDWTRLLTHLPGIDFISVQGIGPDDVWIGGTEGYLLKNPPTAK